MKVNRIVVIASMLFGVLGAMQGTTLASSSKPRVVPAPEGMHQVVWQGKGAINFKSNSRKLKAQDGKVYNVVTSLKIAPIANARTASARGSCNVAEQSVTYNLNGHNALSFRMKQQYCYDGNRVSGIGTKPDETHHWLSDWASYSGWEVGGVQTENAKDYYGNGWAWDVMAKGKFSSYNPVFGFHQRDVFPEVRFYIYGDGRYDVFTAA